MASSLRHRRSTRWTIIAGLGALVAGLVLLVGSGGGRVHADWDSDCVAPFTQTITADSTDTLNLSATDKVLISGGTFSGSVNNNSLGTICVDTGATFNPANINGATLLFVRGTANMPPLAAGAGALLDNEGTVTFTGTPNQNGVADVINRAGGTIIANTLVPLGSDTTVVNDGMIQVNGGVNMNGPNTSVTNNNVLDIVGPMNVSGTLTNTGAMTVSDLLQVNQGSVYNACNLQASALINNVAFTNDGVVLLDNELRNNGQASYTQDPDAFTSGATFTNDGLVDGSGQHLFSGDTDTTGTMAGNSPDDPIIFFDQSQTGDQILDLEEGTITNVVRADITQPGPGACSVEPPPPPPPPTDAPTTVPAPTPPPTDAPTTSPDQPTTTPDPDTPTTSSSTGGPTTDPNEPTTSSSGALPATGTTDTGPAVALAVTLLAVGVGAVALSRRNDPTHR